LLAFFFALKLKFFQSVFFTDLNIMKWILWLCLVICACRPVQLNLPASGTKFTGSEFYQTSGSYNWKQRDSLAIQKFYEGHVPGFLKTLVPVKVSLNQEGDQKAVKAILYVSADYFSIGSNDDWARVPLTPMAARIIADSLDCFLPTRKIVNDIHAAASIKPDPVPLYAFRDSSPTMYHHHLIIEGQRKMRKGLISGIKKDLVNTNKLNEPGKKDRVAIYGWHKADGKPIQPLYTGHVNWYVDYSHGVRLVYQMMKVNGKWMHYKDVLKDAYLRTLICDEDDCEF
jgi:hypothetical protein